MTLYFKDSNFLFPALHLNDKIRSYEERLYTFNAVGLSNTKVRDKVFYHFYQLSNMIFVNVRSKLSEPDLFCDEAVNDGNRLAIAIKFCPDIHPSELTNYHAIVVDAFKDVFANKYIE